MTLNRVLSLMIPVVLCYLAVLWYVYRRHLARVEEKTTRRLVVLGTYALAPFLVVLAAWEVKQQYDKKSRLKAAAKQYSVGHYGLFTAASFFVVLAMPASFYYLKQRFGDRFLGATVTTTSGSEASSSEAPPSSSTGESSTVVEQIDLNPSVRTASQQDNQTSGNEKK